MAAVLFVLVLTVTWLRALVWFYRRGIAHRSAQVTNVYPTPPAAAAEVDALDDTAFRVWLGVLPASYDRYVDTGIEDLEILLADQPVRQAGEDSAGPAS
jgi:hypothetical protein